MKMMFGRFSVKFFLCLAVILLSSGLFGCPGQTTRDDPILLKPLDELTTEDIERMVVVATTDFGSFQFRLYPSEAPEAVNEFLKLARKGFYSGLTFYEVRPELWALAGDPALIEDLAAANSIPMKPNSISHKKGTVGFWRPMVRQDINGPTFYVLLQDVGKMNGSYMAFGKVIEGLPNLDRIGRVHTTGYQGKPLAYQPLDPVVIHDLHLEIRAK